MQSALKGFATRAFVNRPAIAQLVEHLTVECCSNQMVPGSIPGGRIFIAQRAPPKAIRKGPHAQTLIKSPVPTMPSLSLGALKTVVMKSWRHLTLWPSG